jgi:hypothetical protein
MHRTIEAEDHSSFIEGKFLSYKNVLGTVLWRLLDR